MSDPIPREQALASRRIDVSERRMLREVVAINHLTLAHQPAAEQVFSFVRREFDRDEGEMEQREDAEGDSHCAAPQARSPVDAAAWERPARSDVGNGCGHHRGGFPVHPSSYLMGRSAQAGYAAVGLGWLPVVSAPHSTFCARKSRTWAATASGVSRC